MEFPSDNSQNRDVMALLNVVADEAAGYYEPKVEYHGWENHILYSFDRAMELCDEAEAHGLQPNRLVIGLAILWHDSGISHDLLAAEPHGFDSKEAYSAFIAGKVLPEYGLDDETVRQVQQEIMTTKAGEPYVSLESVIVCRADLGNVASDYEFFEDNSFLYKAEIEEACGDDIALTTFAYEAERKLAQLIIRDAPLGDWDRDKNYPEYSRYLVACAQNIQQFVCQFTGEQELPLIAYIEKLKRLADERAKPAE